MALHTTASSREAHEPVMQLTNAPLLLVGLEDELWEGNQEACSNQGL